MASLFDLPDPSLLYPDDPELQKRLLALSNQPVGSEQNPPGFAPPRGWSDTAADVWPNIKRGAQAIGGLLTTDIATPTERAMRFPGLDIPEGAKEEQWDSGTMFRLPDGRLVYPQDLPHRAAVLPIKTDEQWPHEASLAVPGLLDLLPTAGGGAGPAAAEGGVVLGANMARRAGPRVAARLAPDVPEFVEGAAPYIREGGAGPVSVPGPRAAGGAPDLSELSPGLLYDPARGAQAARGATQGMSPEDYARWIADRGMMLDEGVARLNQVGKGERGNASLPNLRAMTPEDAAVTAASDPHLAFKRPDGNYVGAPAGTVTPEDVQRLREAFDAQVARGVGGSDWYQRVQDYIKEVSGGDPIKARQIAEEWAVMSAQADPGTNTAFSLQARNALARGQPADIVRTGQQAKTFNEARAAQEEYLAARDQPGRNSRPGSPDESLDAAKFPAMALGKKTDIYRQHMDPTALEGTTGTNDIWHGRAFGFVDPKTGEEWDKAFGPAQHNWLDYETTQAVNRANAAGLGGRTDWKPGEIQAAPWVSGKSESLQRRFGVDAAEGDRRANATYPDYAPWYTADMPHEQIPGGSTGLTTGSMTPEEWHAAGRRINPGGVDPQLNQLGLMTRGTRQGGGAWQEGRGPVESNPVDIARPLIDTMTDPATDKRIVNPATMKGLESAAAVRGLSDMQIGSPVSFFDRRAGSNKSTAVTIDLGRTTTPEEAKALYDLGDRHGLGFTNTGEGGGFLNFDQTAKGGDVQKKLDAGLAAEIQKIVPGAKIGRADASSANAYVNYGQRMRASNAGKGYATKYMDQILQRNEPAAPGIYQGLLDDPNEAAKAQQNLKRLQASGQIGVRPDYELWQRLIAEGRLRSALEWARANGYRGLPAAVGGAVPAAGLLGGDDSTGGGT